MAGEDGVPHLELETVNLDNPGKYDALSYCWNGDPTSTQEPKEVTVSAGRNFEPQTFRITSNLANAIHQFFQDGEELLIFIDQLCIDQGNVAEKNAQVKQMDEIYSNSNRVLIWLGKATDISDVCMAFTNSLSQQSGNIFRDIASMDISEYEELIIEVASAGLRWERNKLSGRITDLVRPWDGDLGTYIHGFLDILRRPWFNRFWVIQEACLGRHAFLICGGQRVSIDHFQYTLLSFMISLAYYTEKISPFFIAQLELTKLLASFGLMHKTRSYIRKVHDEQKQSDISLYHLVKRFGVNSTRIKIGATDPKDRIYALLGLAKPDDLQEQIKAELDYRESLELTYTRFAAKAIEKDVDLLLFSQPGEDRHVELPSWVPDWSMCLRIPYGYHVIQERVFSAGGESTSSAKLICHVNTTSPATSTLFISGIVVGVIEEVGSAMLGLNNNPSVVMRKMTGPSIGKAVNTYQEIDYDSMKLFLEDIMQFIEKAPATTASSSSGHTTDVDTATARQEAYLRLSIGGLFMRPEPIDYGELQAAHDDLARWSVRLARNDLLLGGSQRLPTQGAISSGLTRQSAEALRQSANLPGISVLNYKRLLTHNIGRRLFMTENGFVGLAPKSIQSGDLVVVMLGASVPFVLRKIDFAAGGNSETAYSYVGEAYCDGIMKGEILGKSDRCEEQEFCIV